MSNTTRRLTLLVAVLGIVAAGCGTMGGSDSSLPVKAGRFRLDEWSITADRSTLHAGAQTITASNIGHETHELVIVGASDAASLPTESDGSVNEARLESATVGEIADIAPGTSKTHTFELPAGTYVVFCNIVEQMGHGDGHGRDGRRDGPRPLRPRNAHDLHRWCVTAPSRAAPTDLVLSCGSPRARTYRDGHG